MATRPARLIPDSRCVISKNGGQLLVLLDFVVTTLPSLIEIHTALGILGNTNNKSVGVE